MNNFSNAHLIVNPKAGGGRARIALPSILQLLEETGLPVTQSIPESPQEARASAEDAIRNGCDLLIAMGGDGLIRDILPAAIESGTPLGIIPLGTGNDLARALGISRDIPEAISTLMQGSVTSIDAARVGDTYFVNVASSGLDAATAAEINRRKMGRGTLAYICALMKILPGFRPAEFELELDGEKKSFRGMLVAVANASSYGGGMLIAPESSLADGLFDIVAVEAMSKLEFLCCFPQVFSGKHVSHPKVRTYRASRVRISADPPQLVMADGDVISKTPAAFEIVPGALKVITR